MNIDMAALHAIEADKGITVDVVIETIKSALLTAYRHTDGHESAVYQNASKPDSVTVRSSFRHEADKHRAYSSVHSPGSIPPRRRPSKC